MIRSILRAAFWSFWHSELGLRRHISFLRSLHRAEIGIAQIVDTRIVRDLVIILRVFDSDDFWLIGVVLLLFLLSFTFVKDDF